MNELISIFLSLLGLSCLCVLILTEVLANVTEECENAIVSEVITEKWEGRDVFVEKPTIPSRFKTTIINKVSKCIVVVVPSTLEYSCTGFLLSPNWAITAAQCFHIQSSLMENHTSIMVFAKVHTTFDWTNPKHEHKSSRLVIHPHFAYIPARGGRTGFYINNLALIEVTKPFRQTDCLPVASKAWSQQYRGRLVCQIYGYTTFKMDEYNPLELSLKTRELLVSKPCRCMALLNADYGHSSRNWACLSEGDDGFEPGACVVCDGIVRGMSLGNLYVGDLPQCMHHLHDAHDPVDYSPITHLAVITDLCPYLEWLASHDTSLPATIHCSPATRYTLHYGLLLIVIHLCTII